MTAEEDVTLRMHEMRARLERLNALLRSGDMSEGMDTSSGAMHSIQANSHAVQSLVSSSPPRPQPPSSERDNGGDDDATTTHVTFSSPFAGALLHEQPIQPFHVIHQRLRQKLRHLELAKLPPTGVASAISTGVVTHVQDTVKPTHTNASGSAASLASSPSSASPPHARRGPSAETATPPHPVTPPTSTTAAGTIEARSAMPHTQSHQPQKAKPDVELPPSSMELRQTNDVQVADIHSRQGVAVSSHPRPKLCAQVRVMHEGKTVPPARRSASRGTMLSQRTFTSARTAPIVRVDKRATTAMSSSRDSRRSVRVNAAPVAFTEQATVLESLTTAELLAVLRMRRVIASSGTVPAMPGEGFAAPGYRHAIYLTPLEHAQLLLLRSALHAVKASHTPQALRATVVRPASARRVTDAPPASLHGRTTRNASRCPSCHA